MKHISLIIIAAIILMAAGCIDKPTIVKAPEPTPISTVEIPIPTVETPIPIYTIPTIEPTLPPLPTISEDELKRIQKEQDDFIANLDSNKVNIYPNYERKKLEDNPDLSHNW